MTYRVTSDRIGFEAGAIVDEVDLTGCNIAALIQGGHLEPVTKDSSKRKSETPAPEPKTTIQRSPVVPVPNDTADEPEEQD
jgi:hypothetical protein